jgi:hypothetical protein
MSDESLILSSDNGAEDLVIKNWHVALVYTKATKLESGEDSLEIRHQMLECQATDQGAAEWFGRKISEGDGQMPAGYVFNSAVAMEIKP